MPDISETPYGCRTQVVLTFDAQGCHPWRGDGPVPTPSVRVTYDPGWQTIGYFRALDEARKPDSRDAPVIVEFLSAIKAWDVSKDGHPIELSAAALELVPVDLMRAIVNGVTEDMKNPATLPQGVQSHPEWR